MASQTHYTKQSTPWTTHKRTNDGRAPSWNDKNNISISRPGRDSMGMSPLTRDSRISPHESPKTQMRWTRRQEELEQGSQDQRTGCFQTTPAHHHTNHAGDSCSEEHKKTGTIGE